MTVINPRTKRVPSFGVEVVLVVGCCWVAVAWLGLLTLLQLSWLVHQSWLSIWQSNKAARVVNPIAVVMVGASVMAQHLAEQ
jgi:hypothetical protein